MVFTKGEDGCRWTHYRDLKGECPLCGRSAHAGVRKYSERFVCVWLHDDYGSYLKDGSHEPCEIEYGDFERMFYEAERKAVLEHRRENASAREASAFGRAFDEYLREEMNRP